MAEEYSIQLRKQEQLNRGRMERECFWPVSLVGYPHAEFPCRVVLLLPGPHPLPSTAVLGEGWGAENECFFKPFFLTMVLMKSKGNFFWFAQNLQIQNCVDLFIV